MFTSALAMDIILVMYHTNRQSDHYWPLLDHVYFSIGLHVNTIRYVFVYVFFN